MRFATQRPLQLTAFVSISCALAGCFPDPPAPDTSHLADLEAVIEPETADSVDGDGAAIEIRDSETSTDVEPVDTDPSTDANEDIEADTAQEASDVTECGDCAHLDGPCFEGACSEGGCIAVPTTSPCDDGSACTRGDACNDGVCVGTYDAALCACQSDADCDDDNDCNGIETCGSDKQCKQGTAVTCAAPSSACEDNVCVPATGRCEPVALDDVPCNDAQTCTTSDRCDDGVCKGSPVVCSPIFACGTATCIEATGLCEQAQGSCECLLAEDCDDLDACNGSEACDEGRCEAGTPITCPASQVACQANTCSGGACVLLPLDDTPCSDGSRCTESDRCDSGTCLGVALACDDVVTCGVGACSEQTGQCQYDRSECECVVDSDCDDEDACTGRESCNIHGECVPGTPVTCPSSQVMCKRSTCVPATGACTLIDDNTATCDDGLYCTSEDRCENGACLSTPRNCGDGIGCTTDSCSEVSDQCTHVANGCCATSADCDDGNICNGAETCDQGTLACRAGTPPSNGFPCNDGLVCTTPDSCQGQVCVGASRVCNDGYSCSVDSCSEGGGGCVVNASLCECTSNAQCDDGLSCTTDTCNGDGVCVHTTAPNQCLIDGACYASGATLARAPSCGICQPNMSQTAWTARGGTNPWPLALGYWANTSVASSVELTSLCRATAVSCHNCYVEAASATSSVNQTVSKISDALSRGADIIELDVVDVSGVPRLSHDDSNLATRASLEDVLASSAWGSRRPVLFLEIKEQQASTTFLSNLVQVVADNGFADSGRRVVVRAFSGLDSTLTLTKSIAAGNARGSGFRFHLLYDTHQGATVDQMKALIDTAVAAGFHGVELNYKHRALLSKLQYARSRGLATGVWTLPQFLGEMLVGGLVDDVDIITSDLAIEVARSIVALDKNLAHLDVNAASAGATQVSYFQTTPSPVALALSSGAPTIVTDTTYGSRSALRFVAASSQSLTLYDADNGASDGYLLAFYGRLNIDSIVPNDGDAAVLIGKADSGGVSLEVNNPVAAGPNLLRFAVNVGGTYYYTDLPASNVPSDTPVLIIAAYDGSGGVRMMVDGNDANVVVANANGGVLQNNSPFVVGADPQGATNRRYYFEGSAQWIKVVSWPQSF